MEEGRGGGGIWKGVGKAGSRGPWGREEEEEDWACFLLDDLLEARRGLQTRCIEPRIG